MHTHPPPSPFPTHPSQPQKHAHLRTNKHTHPHLQVAAGRPFPCQYRARYRQPLAACTVEPDPDEPTAFLRVIFESPQRAVAVQQTLALYLGARCLGGGAIAASGPSYFEMGKVLPEERIEWAVS